MMELTKERLQEIAEDGFLKHGEAKAMARQLLASMEQEPVGVINGARKPVLYSEPAELAVGTKLYAAPQLPQPAVTKWPAPHKNNQSQGWRVCPEFLHQIREQIGDDEENYDLCPSLEMVEAVLLSAAMLQGAEPVSKPYTLREGVAAIRNSGIAIDAEKIQAERDALNEPVQGWIPCSERMPEEIGRYWCYVEEQNSLGKSHYQWNCSWNGDRWWVESENGGRVTHWMPLPAAPQQEADNG